MRLYQPSLIFTICMFILSWCWQIRSVLLCERWMAPSVLADIVVWVSESGLGWWITLLMILAGESACFKKPGIGWVWVSHGVRAPLQQPKSTLDYLMFLFYKPGLICRAKKQETQSADLKESMLDFFFSINKTCRLNSRRCHCNIIHWFTFEMFAFTVPLVEDVLCDWAHPDCSVARERAPYLPSGATRSCVHISSWAVTHSRGERVLSWGQHLCSPAKKARLALRGQAAVQHSVLCVASTQAERWAAKRQKHSVRLAAALCWFHRRTFLANSVERKERKLSLWT